MRYVFGNYTLDAERYELREAGRLVPVEPRVFDLLAYLVQHPGRTMLTEELLTQLYPNEFAPVERLTSAVAQARRVLHDTAQTQHSIQTIRRRGYRWCVPVTPQPPEGADLPAPAVPDLLEAAEQASIQGQAVASPRPLPRDPLPMPPSEASTAGVPPGAGPGMSQAERRQLTVLVCRLVGVAERAKGLDPEELFEVVQDYHALGAEVARRFDGYIAQYQGDRLVVYFGYPHAHEDDARRAVHTGLGLVERMTELQRRRTRAGGVQLAVRVGIHTGVVVVGAMGHDEHALLALGETPPIAAQLQDLAAPNTVVIGSTTLRLVERYFSYQALGTYILEEPAEPLAVYQIRHEEMAQNQFEGTVVKGFTPLVGREQELQLLRERWAQVQDGWGQGVLLSGEAGIGKSRLVHALTEHLTGEAYTRIACHASPYYQQSAFYPVVEYVHQLLQRRQDETPEDKLHKLEAVLGAYDFALEEVVPLFTVLLSLPLAERYAPLALTPERQKQKLLEVLLTWLLRETEQQPVCLIMEDLHWVDPSTLEWLSLLIDQIPTTRVLLLLTFRPDFQPPWAVRSPLIHLTLDRLSPRQTEGMIGQVVGGKPLPVEVMQQVVTTTDGVPLFVEELTKMVLELGLVKEREERYELIGPLPSLAIPTTLHDSLMARLDRLGSAKQIAQLGAVVGREFTYEVLQAMAPMDEANLQKALTQLVKAELLYQRGLPPQAQYRFKHALIQGTAYRSLLRSTQRQYHQQIAQALEEQFPDTCELHPELVAHHYTEAGLSIQAIRYWQRAGQRAIERSANLEAISHLTKGLEVLQTLPETPERHRQELTLQLAVGVALTIIKGHTAPEIEHTYTRAYELCQLVGDSRQAFSTLCGLIRFYTNRAQLQRACALGEQCLALAQRLQDPLLLQEAHTMLGTPLCFHGELGAADRHLEHAIALYDPQQGRARAFSRGIDSRVSSLTRWAWVLWLLGYPDRALTRMHEALMWAQELSHPYSLSYALHLAARLHQFRREVLLVHEMNEASLVLARAEGFAYLFAAGMWLQGWVAVEQGAIQEGIGQLQNSLAHWRSIGIELELPEILAQIAEAYGKGGDPEEGLRVLAEAVMLVHRTAEYYQEAELYRLKGELLLRDVARHKVEEAEESFLQAIHVARHRGAKALELRAVMSLSALWQQQGKGAEARQMLVELYGWFTEGFDTADLQQAKALMEELTRERSVGS